tara:strand:+ start:4402 stop:5115 length:714 start_codon:yes stop_codon:yes gene_type:complete
MRLSLFTVYFSLSFSIFAQSDIQVIKEQYWKIENNDRLRDYMDYELYHIKPFYENFVVGREVFFPSYIFHGNYETTYIFKDGILKECQYLSYSTKEDKILNFNYNIENKLKSIISSSRTVNLEYTGRQIKVMDSQGYTAELSLTEGNIYEFKSGKTGNFIFYHYPDKIESIFPKKQFKTIHYYEKNRLIMMEILLYGKKLNTIELAYENDAKGNWIKKTIIKDNIPIAMVTRTISYK